MNLDRALGVAGVLLGLPGFAALFLTPYDTAAAITLALAAVTIAAALLIRSIANRPPYSMDKVEARLDLTNPDRATHEKVSHVRANVAGLTTLQHKNIASDGTIEDFRWDGDPVPAADIVPDTSAFKVIVRLPLATTRGQQFTGRLSYVLVKSFPARNEFYSFSVDFPTKLLLMSITFPDNRPSLSQKARVSFGGQEREINGVDVQEGGKRVFLKVKHPKVGSTISIHWSWQLVSGGAPRVSV